MRPTDIDWDEAARKAMPDDLFILSADGGKLALWEALE